MVKEGVRVWNREMSILGCVFVEKKVLEWDGILCMICFDDLSRISSLIFHTQSEYMCNK